MNGARQTWLVAAREIRERGRSRTFLGSLLLMLVAVAGAIVLPSFLDTGPGTKDVGLTGTAPAGLIAALQAQGAAVETTIRIHRYDTRLRGEAAVRDGDLDVLVVDARQLEWRKRADEQLKAVVSGAIELVAVRDRAEAAGMNPDELLAIAQPVALTNIELGRVEGGGADDETAAFLVTMVLFFGISTYGAMVLSGVIEEKSSRIVEVLLARMPARNLLAGKIAGIGLLGLGQIAILLVLGLMVSFAAMGSIDTTWARLISWFPTTAPLAMPNRIAMGVASWWDPVIAISLTLATIAGLVVVGGRYLHPRHPPHRSDALPRRSVARRAAPVAPGCLHHDRVVRTNGGARYD